MCGVEIAQKGWITDPLSVGQQFFGLLEFHQLHFKVVLNLTAVWV